MKAKRRYIHRGTLSALVGLFTLVSAIGVSHAQTSQNDLVRASLVTDVRSIQPGRTFMAAVRLEMADSWHINWRNPGDAGLAPGVQWTAPEGFRVERAEWPIPHRYSAGPLVIFGYEGELMMVVHITPPTDLAAGGKVTLAAGVSWLACQESCVPGEADLSIELPVEAQARADAKWHERFDTARQQQPIDVGGWRLEAWYEDDHHFYIDLQSALGSHTINGVYFFPFEQGLIENAATQRLTMLTTMGGTGGYRLRIERARMMPATPDRLVGVIVSDNGFEQEGRAQGMYVDIPLRSR